MNLTKALKELVVDRFKAGEPIHRIALWYGQTPEKIEAVIRGEFWALENLKEHYREGFERVEKEWKIARADTASEGSRKPDAA